MKFLARLPAWFAFALLAPDRMAADWPAWRGPASTGVSTEATLPLRWSATENVKWRVPLREPGNSTPVVWGERVFVTQAVGDRRTLMCFDRADGRLRWQQGITTAQREPTHATNPYCSGSPVTDGERAIAAFASDGLFCFDLDGRELWTCSGLNPLGERSNASVVASGGELFIRTHQALWCIAEAGRARAP